MAYSPAFQFYPGDFTGDKNTVRMTATEIGAYWLLICECWDKDNCLPDDLDELAEITRLERDEFEVVWNRRIKKCFLFDDRQKVFTHKRLSEEIKKQKAFKKKRSESGMKGMRNRWKQTTSSDNTDITPDNTVITPDNSDITKHNSLSLSPFPFSSSFSLGDLKRLIDVACAREEYSDVDPWLIVCSILETLINRNGSTESIRSIKYFDEHIRHVAALAEKAGLKAGSNDKPLALNAMMYSRCRAFIKKFKFTEDEFFTAMGSHTARIISPPIMDVDVESPVGELGR